MNARDRQMWERRAREQELRQDQRRFQVLDSDDDDFDNLAVSELRHHDDLAYGDDYDELSYEYEQGHDMQMVLRNKEEELAERAMRRIRRARMKGESSVDLSREELDALEKRRYRQQMVRAPLNELAESGATIEAAPVPSSRPSSSSKSPPSGKAKSKASGKAGKNSKAGATAPKGGKGGRTGASVPMTEEEAESPSAIELARTGYFSRPGNTSPGVTRASSRSAMRPHSSHHEIVASGYRPGSSGSMRLRADASPTRSLPDDPDWVPTSRSRSSSQLYKTHSQSSQSPGNEALGYQVGGPGYGGPGGRRIVSEPMHPAVAYSSLRRSVGAGAGGGGGRSGLGREYIEVPVGEEDDVDEESDEGVRVDLTQAESYGGTGYRLGTRAAGQQTGARTRRGR